MKKSLYSVLLLTAIIFFYSCTSNKQEINLDTNRDVVKKYHEVWSNGQVTELDKVLTSNFVCHFINGIDWKGITEQIIRLQVIENHFQTGRRK